MSEEKKQRRRTTIFALTGGVLLLLVVTGFSYCYYNREMTLRADCAGGLRCISLAVMQYQMDHNSAYPPTLGTLFDRYLPDDAIFACPGASKGREGGRMDYLYIDWSERAQKESWSWKKEPYLPKYPRIYDRRLSNHGKIPGWRGINILMVDDSVMWDKDARWLKEFARTHPKAEIPIPEDAP